MKITVWKTGGVVGIYERLGPVDTDQMSGAAGTAVMGMVENLRFFGLPEELEPGGAFDDFHVTVHIVHGEREHQVAYDGLSKDPAAAKLGALVQALQERGGFDFEDQNGRLEEEAQP